MEIVVDTSAFVAIYRAEEGTSSCEQAIAQASTIYLPASCRLEAALLRRQGVDFFDWFRRFTSLPLYRDAELTGSVIEIAIAAARFYGKGSGHPAQLNFGDCLVYAVAKERDLPLLFVGDDFGLTDVTPAIAQRSTG
ncbi:MAG: type II toxin-antitoxin system VapC family toxin [Mesorhizobium sp.]